MTTAPVKLAVIIASVREGRFGPVVARWFIDQADRHGGFEVDLIDLADAELPLAVPSVSPMIEPNPPRPDGMLDLTARLTAADAFVIVTPDYNRSYPAALKSAIDWHFTQWDAKAIGFVGYSGASGGLLAIEHLRQIFNELNAHTGAITSRSRATTCSSTPRANCSNPKGRRRRPKPCSNSCIGGHAPSRPLARCPSPPDRGGASRAARHGIEDAR